MLHKGVGCAWPTQCFLNNSGDHLGVWDSYTIYQKDTLADGSRAFNYAVSHVDYDDDVADSGHIFTSNEQITQSHGTVSWPESDIGRLHLTILLGGPHNRLPRTHMGVGTHTEPTATALTDAIKVTNHVLIAIGNRRSDTVFGRRQWRHPTWTNKWYRCPAPGPQPNIVHPRSQATMLREHFKTKCKS